MSARVRSLLYIGLIVALLLIGWLVLRQNGWEGHVRSWLDLLVRWIHIIVGIAWIGTSFYFIFLENSLEREKVREELAGSLWAIHGGGFYYVEKYRVAPEKLPEKLHWFKWEAYFTWISGFVLLGIVYYSNANLYLAQGAPSWIRPWVSIAIGVLTLIVSWVVYDRLCRTPLVDRRGLFALVGFLLVVAAAYLLTLVFTGRAAYIHVGALLGTLMAGNVFFVIIPSQKALVRAAERGEPLDPGLGQHAGLRSLHNNYLTLPVVFVMIGNHFPMTFEHGWNWAVLAGLFVGSVAVRHFLNLRERGRDALILLPLATVILLALAYVTVPARRAQEGGEPVTFEQARGIIEQHCTQCHAEEPSDAVFTVAPSGVKLDSPERIQAQAKQILENAVQSSYMPLGNQTGMTEEERELLGRWIWQGASLE